MKYINKVLPRKRSRMTKRILGFLAIFALSGVFLQGNVGVQEVHATDVPVQSLTNTTPTSITTLGLVDLLDLVLKVVYILLWPLLVVAGRAMDNTLVYGSLFHLDVPLWKFWNIIKNFANFTMGFLVLFAILKSFFSKEGIGTLKDGKTPLGIIKKTLIAGILIQASRFLVAATIDMSTVATYAVGGLPLSVLKTTDLGQKKILAVDAKIDLNKIQNMNDKGDIISLTYSAGPHKLSSCQLSTNMEGGAARYIVGRSVSSGTEMGKCVFGGNMVMFFNETGLHDLELAPYANDGLDGGGSSPENYLQFIQGKQQSCVPSTELVKRGMIIDIYSGNSFNASKDSGAVWFASTPAMMLSDLVTKSKGFVGPMVMIYSSLLNFAEISDSGTDSFGKITGEMIIRTGFALMLFFPLLALAVVLIIRVGFLWLVIAASPFIVLLEVFKESLPKLPENITKHIDIKNIFAVIFAPVVTVFALSLAVIFITTLISTFTPKTGSTTPATDTSLSTAFSPTIQKLPSEGGSQKYLVGGSQMTLTNFSRGGSLDWFSWIIVNLVSLGLMRALVFAAIKANSLGKGVGQKIQDFGGNFMATLPIIPVPGSGERVGFGSMAKVAQDTPDRYISHIKGEQEAMAQKLVDAKFHIGEENEGKITTEQTTQIIAAAQRTPGGDITPALVEAGIAKENISETINGNGAMIYNAIMTDNKITDKKSILNTIWAPATDKEGYQAIAKTQLEEKFKIEDKATDETIQSALAKTDGKVLDNYFALNTEYKTTVGDTEFTITRKDNKFDISRKTISTTDTKTTTPNTET